MTGRKKPSGRKPGAQKGNKNALKHGFYSKDFTADQIKRLDGQAVTDVEAEINLIRICLDNLQKQLNFEEIIHNDDKGNTTRDDHYLRQLNTLAVMTQSLSTLVRTHYLTRGKDSGVLSDIEQALTELRLEMGI